MHALFSIRNQLLFIYLLSAGLMICAARGDLWLDEVWSIHYAREASSAADLLFRFKHDNNHFLNTLFLYCLGEQPTYIAYRLLSVVSGVGSILLLGHVARRDWGDPEALCSVALAGTSFPLLLYFSEARGYAPAIFFAILAYTVLAQNLISPKLPGLLIFWTASVLGILSHATFVMVSVALFMMNFLYSARTHEPRKKRLLEFFLHQVLPFAFIGFWYLFFLQHMAIGGGPIYEKSTVIKKAASLLLGFPDAAPFSTLAILAALAVIIGGTFSLYRAGHERWLFFVGVLLLAPALMLVFMQPRYLYFRYFIVCFPFFYLLVAHMVCRCFQAWSHPYKLLLTLAIFVSITGQAYRLDPLLTQGRSAYSAALAYLLKRSPEPTILIGSDNDFRNSMLLDFYAPRLTQNKNLRYIQQPDWHQAAPDWLFANSSESHPQPPGQYSIKGVGIYQLVADFMTANEFLFLYQRVKPDKLLN